MLALSLNNSIVSAVGDVVVLPQEQKEISPSEELESVKQFSLFALYSTRDYVEIVSNNLAMVATSRIKDYKQVSERITKLVESSNSDNAKYCAWFTETILVERIALLTAYIKFAGCYSARDAVGCKNYNSQIKYYSNRAAELYQSFIKTFDIKF